MTQESDPRVFELGLVTAGAISAGAYTAGVMDFLCQALAEWQKAIDRGEAKEKHRVRISIISGASAGAVAGGLGVIALADRLSTPIGEPEAHVPVPFLPKLHEAWVVRPRMMAKDGECFLGITDLTAAEPVRSILDSSVLDGIAKQILDAGTPQRRVPWIGEPLHVYMATGNLRGVPYVLKCIGHDGTEYRHAMTMHADYMHFRVSGLGVPGASLPVKDGLDINCVNLPSAPGRTDRWWLFATSALASAAFPVGLAPRALQREDKAEYATRPWSAGDGNVHIEPAWPDGMPKTYDCVNVDGGVFNNEPFEFARQALSGGPNRINPREGENADRAVLLIDPFPDEPDFSVRYIADSTLVKALPALLSAWKQQARFKPNELALALDESKYSRFVIAPRRVEGGTEDRFPLASGLLGGFGGFLSQDFREADYQLGRRNCQAFLMRSLVFPGGNIVIGGEKGTEVPLIPLYGGAVPEVPLVTPWPQFPSSQLEKLQAAIAERTKRLVPRLIDQTLDNPVIRWVLKLLWKVLGNNGAAKAARLTIQANLIRRGQIDGQWAFDSQDERDVFAALCEPGCDLHTLEGLAKKTRLSPSQVYGILEKRRYLWVAYQTKLGTKGYTLTIRDRNWLARKLIPPSVDNGEEAELV